MSAAANPERGEAALMLGGETLVLRPTFGEESLRWSIYTGLGFYLLAALLFFLASRRLDKDWVE